MKKETAASLLLLALLLSGCGGGSPEPELDKTTQPVDCKANPEACK